MDREIVLTFTDNDGKTFETVAKKSWDILEIKVFPILENMKNVVKTIFWKYNLTVTLNSTEYSSFQTGISVFSDPDKNSEFIEYEKLTKDIICNWLEQNNNLEQLNNMIQFKIQSDFTPPIVSMPLPF